MAGDAVSGLLKAGDRTAQSAVRRLGAVPLAPRKPAIRPAAAIAPPVDLDQREPGFRPDRNAARTEELDRQCMDLEAEIAELRHSVQEAEVESAGRIEEAFERGRSEGRDAAERSEKLRLEALTSALAEIGGEHRSRLGDCELLALQLARTAVSRIFGEAERPAELVSATLAHHLARMKTELVVGVRVSPEDFDDHDALAALAQSQRGISLQIDGDLATGECEIDLKLGKVDIGIDGQWQRLSAFFDELADEGRSG